MRRFAVTVYVEAEDAVDAIDAAGDVWVDVDEMKLAAACDDGRIKIRPARRNEFGGSGETAP